MDIPHRSSSEMIAGVVCVPRIVVAKTAKSQQIRRFKFWFDQGLQDGMQYQQALFERICTLDNSQRKQLYQQARQFAHQGADTLVTYEQGVCHLWINLKDRPIATALLSRPFKNYLPNPPASSPLPSHQLSHHKYK